MSDEQADIDITHEEVGIEVHEHDDLHELVVAMRTDEDRLSICLAVPEVAALCHEMRGWLARKGIDDEQTENLALRWREEHPADESEG